MHKSLTLAVRAAMVVGALGLVAGCSNVTPEQLDALIEKLKSAPSEVVRPPQAQMAEMRKF